MIIWWMRQHRISEYLNSSQEDFMIISNLPYTKFISQKAESNQPEIWLHSIFKNPRDKARFTNLARQFMPWKYKFLLWAFEDTTKLTRSYLLLDMRPEVYDRYRICGRIFNDAHWKSPSRCLHHNLEKM